ncbi:MAG: methyltransferase domain-containing protein, partial [Lentisphaeraceae bacterium]|nr:methyltransferase domain-containing protein [Lentisphaeraceae bacterium]
MIDKVFSQGDFQKGSFRFNSSVASVFDDMASRSIPFYREVIQLTGKVAETFVPDGGRVYDLGCSTGNTLMYLAQSLQDKKVKLIGCDPAEAMLQKAAEKAEAFTYSHNIEFIQNTCESIELTAADLIIMNYTLQFIDKAERPALLKKIYDALKPGGVFIISEKLKQQSERV